MSNKLRNIFSSDPNVASDGIKQMIKTAYDKQWCTTCKKVYYEGDDVLMKCKISPDLCRKRQWGGDTPCKQYCLFYEPKNKEKELKECLNE